LDNNTISLFGFLFSAETGIVISRFRPETEKAIAPVHPVQ